MGRRHVLRRVQLVTVIPLLRGANIVRPREPPKFEEGLTQWLLEVSQDNERKAEKHRDEFARAYWADDKSAALRAARKSAAHGTLASGELLASMVVHGVGVGAYLTSKVAGFAGKQLLLAGARAITPRH